MLIFARLVPSYPSSTSSFFLHNAATPLAIAHSSSSTNLNTHLLITSSSKLFHLTVSRSSSDPTRLAPLSPPEGDDDHEGETELVSLDDEADEDTGFEIVVEKMVGENNRRRIRSRIRVGADLESVWAVLTDYEGLATFIPSLAVSRLLEKGEKFAKLYQVGQQDLALGLKFDAKGVLDCYERDLEHLPRGRRREIEFDMVDGDFRVFQGRWSIEQIGTEMDVDEGSPLGLEFQTTLSYSVELEPKLWLPVGLLEGRICREVKTNLQCVREEAQRVQRMGSDALPSWENGGTDTDLTDGT